MKKFIIIVLVCLFALALCQQELNPRALYKIERKSITLSHALTMDRRGKVSTKRWRNRRNQMWRFVPSGQAGKYQIINAESSKPLSIRTGRVFRRESNVFEVAPFDQTYYRIIDDRGRALTGGITGRVRMSGLRRGASENQLWKITEVSQ